VPCLCATMRTLMDCGRLAVMAETHQNTGAIAVGWNWIEPEKGKYDFKILDAAIETRG